LGYADLQPDTIREAVERMAQALSQGDFPQNEFSDS
jgi:hypothetical protein